MHFWRIEGSTRAVNTFSCAALNVYVAESFIRDSQLAQVPAWSGRTRDAPETPQKREYPRADRLHLPPSRRLSQWLPSKAPTREATIPRRLRDRLSPLRLSPRLRR